MFGHVSRRAAIFSAQRQPLQQAQCDENDWRGDAPCGVIGQHTDDEGRYAHQHDGDEESVLAPNQIAQPSKHQGAEGTHGEARGKCQQRKDEGGRLVNAGEELLADDAGQRTVEVKVVPLENGPQ